MWESIFLINQTKVKEIPPPNNQKKHTHQKKKHQKSKFGEKKPATKPTLKQVFFIISGKGGSQALNINFDS